MAPALSAKLLNPFEIVHNLYVLLLTGIIRSIQADLLPAAPFIVRVIHDFTAESADELDLTKGQVLCYN